MNTKVKEVFPPLAVYIMATIFAALAGYAAANQQTLFAEGFVLMLVVYMAVFFWMWMSPRATQNAPDAQKGWFAIKRVAIVIAMSVLAAVVFFLEYLAVKGVIDPDWGATVRSLVFWVVVAAIMAAVAIPLGLFFFRKQLKEWIQALRSRKRRRESIIMLRVRELAGVRSFLFSARGTKDPQLQRGNLEEAATALNKMDDFKDKASILAFIEAAQHATEALLRVDNINLAISKVMGVINALRKGSLSEQPSLDREAGTPQPTGSGQDTKQPRSGEGGVTVADIKKSSEITGLNEREKDAAQKKAFRWKPEDRLEEKPEGVSDKAWLWVQAAYEQDTKQAELAAIFTSAQKEIRELRAALEAREKASPKDAQLPGPSGEA